MTVYVLEDMEIERARCGCCRQVPITIQYRPCMLSSDTHHLAPTHSPFHSLWHQHTHHSTGWSTNTLTIPQAEVPTHSPFHSLWHQHIHHFTGWSTNTLTIPQPLAPPPLGLPPSDVQHYHWTDVCRWQWHGWHPAWLRFPCRSCHTTGSSGTLWKVRYLLKTVLQWKQIKQLFIQLKT